MLLVVPYKLKSYRKYYEELENVCICKAVESLQREQVTKGATLYCLSSLFKLFQVLHPNSFLTVTKSVGGQYVFFCSGM